MTQSDDTKPESRPKSTHGGHRTGNGRKPSPFGSPVAKKIPRNLLPVPVQSQSKRIPRKYNGINKKWISIYLSKNAGYI